jgi:3-isopropylmalate/(R)-2-methylmalate dehydratase small subunit
MEKFTELTGIAAPMLMANINTDLIAPTLMPGRTHEQAAEMSLRGKMFANLRFAPDGTPRQNFVLNKRVTRERAL